MVAADLEVEFPAGMPRWLGAFVDDPATSISALLGGRWYHGSLNAEDPDELLLDWASGLREVEGFAAALDAALSHWIADEWLAGSTDAAVEVMWHRALRTVALLEVDTPRALDALRAGRDDARDFLGPMTQGPSLDPMGWYWHCLAGNQPTRDLLATWWELCNLDPGVPYFHGRIGLLGLRRVPGDDLGGFRPSAASGLVRLASALDDRVEARMLPERTAQRAARAAALESVHAYPFRRDWSAFWSDAVQGLRPRPRGWLASVFGAAGTRQTRGEARARAPRFDRDWPARARWLAAQLRRGSAEAVPAARALVAEQTDFAAATGDTDGAVRTLCMLSAAIRTRNPALALEWAEAAIGWDKWNAFTWTSAAAALLEMGDAHGAALRAFEAVERFPDNVVARSGLAEVLKALGRLDDAAERYRETIELFPDNVVARNGLAEVLKALGRLDDAAERYCGTIELFPDNVVARSGLAEVLKALGRLDDAAVSYRETIELFPDNVVARNGLAEVLKALRRLDDAAVSYRETIELFPDNVVARTGLAEVLKALGRLDDAAESYRDTIELFPDNVVARNGLAEVLKALGRLDDAAVSYRDTIELFPDNVVARNGLAGVLKALGRLDEAVVSYRDAIELFPDNAVARTGLAGVRAAISEVGGAPGSQADEEPDDQDATISQAAGVMAAADAQGTTGGDRIESDQTGGDPVGANLPPDERVKWARLLLGIARLTPTGLRSQPLAEAEPLIDAVLADQPRHALALFSKLELLLEQGHLDDAVALVVALPEYLRRRPEFLALKGRLAWEQARLAGEVRYTEPVIDAIVGPWVAAGRLHGALAANIPLARMRAASIVYDGQAVVEERDKAVTAMRSLIARGDGDGPRGPRQRNAVLRAWWSGEVAGLFGAEQPFEQLEATLNEHRDLLDSLEVELIDAARYSASAT